MTMHVDGPFDSRRVSRFSNLSTSRIVNKASHSSTPRERTSRDPPRVAGLSRHPRLSLVRRRPHPTDIPAPSLPGGPILHVPSRFRPRTRFCPSLLLSGDPSLRIHGERATAMRRGTLTAYLSLRHHASLNLGECSARIRNPPGPERRQAGAFLLGAPFTGSARTR
jgi:hypothetical protein